MNFVTHDYFALVVPIVYVEIFLIRRESQAVWTREVGGDEFQFAIDQAEDAAERKLLTRVIEEFRHAERRISEEQRTVGAIDEIVWAVQALALIAIGENSKLSVSFETRDAPVAMLVDRYAALLIKREAIR